MKNLDNSKEANMLATIAIYNAYQKISLISLFSISCCPLVSYQILAFGPTSFCSVFQNIL